MLSIRTYPRRCYGSWMTLLLIAAMTHSYGSLAAQEVQSNASIATRDQDGSLRHTWQLGGFVNGGFVPSYHLLPPFSNGQIIQPVNLNFFSAGLEGGMISTKDKGPGFLRGRGEVAMEFIPFWLADYPTQTMTYCYVNGDGCLSPCLGNGVTCNPISWGPERRFGISITPFLLRWNFMREASGRAFPWAQLGGGLLWTNHKFPLQAGDSRTSFSYTPDTSVINFTPQAGIGESVFVGKNRSVDFAIKAVHISNAGLGDNNPGLNVTLQFSAGYSWWK